MTVIIKLKEGSRGRWRWIARDKATGRTVGVSPVRGYETRQEAVEAVSSLLMADVEWED